MYGENSTAIVQENGANRQISRKPQPGGAAGATHAPQPLWEAYDVEQVLIGILTGLEDFYRGDQTPHQLAMYFTSCDQNGNLLFSGKEFLQLVTRIQDIPDEHASTRQRLQAGLFGVLLDLIGSNMLHQSHVRLPMDNQLLEVMLALINTTPLTDLSWAIRQGWDLPLAIALFLNSERSWLEVMSVLLPAIVFELFQSIPICLVTLGCCQAIAVTLTIMCVILGISLVIAMIMGEGLGGNSISEGLKLRELRATPLGRMFILGGVGMLPILTVFAIPFTLFDVVRNCCGKSAVFGFHHDIYWLIEQVVTTRYSMVSLGTMNIMLIYAISPWLFAVTVTAAVMLLLASYVAAPLALVLLGLMAATAYHALVTCSATPPSNSVIQGGDSSKPTETTMVIRNQASTAKPKVFWSKTTHRYTADSASSKTYNRLTDAYLEPFRHFYHNNDNDRKSGYEEVQAAISAPILVD